MKKLKIEKNPHPDFNNPDILRLAKKINEIIDMLNPLLEEHVQCGIKPGSCNIPVDGVCGH